MDQLTGALATVLRWMVVLLPAHRREWARAVRYEAAAVPPGRARLWWVIGGLWLVIQEAEVIRRVSFTVAGVAAGAAMVWLGWHPGSANPAVPAERVAMVVVVVVLAVLPWVARPVIGPVADNRVARVVRTGGYVAVYTFVLVMAGLSRFAGSRFDHFQAFDQDNWEADMRSGAVIGAVVIVLTIGGYAAAILIATARRTRVAPTNVAAGAGFGAGAAVIAYALMPLGNPLHLDNAWLTAGYSIVLFAALPAGFLAAGRFGGTLAGLYAGGAAALLLSVLTIGTMLILPGQVDLIWANPDPNVTHGTTYELQMSVGDTAIKYQLGLLLLPLIGLVFGAVGSSLAAQQEPAPVVAPEGGPVRVGTR